MLDSNWDLIDGDAAHEIEVLNYSNQVNVIEALVRFLMHHHGKDGQPCPASPNLHVVREFHRTATLFLLARPGSFREEAVEVRDNNGVVVHSPPPHERVEELMGGFFVKLRERWVSSDPIAMASYSLWLINWVHPFKNGNGRTARAFCYACLSLKLGFVLPGSPTVIDLIMQKRSQYYSALRTADKGYIETGEPTLSELDTFIAEMLTEQLSSIEN